MIRKFITSTFTLFTADIRNVKFKNKSEQTDFVYGHLNLRVTQKKKIQIVIAMNIYAVIKAIV